MTATQRHALRVLVAGGGVAALETVLALQSLAGDRVAIELLAPDRHFTYRPTAVVEPFSAVPPQRFPLEAIAAERNVRFRRDALAGVQAGRRTVTTQGGDEIAYDALVLAVGARVVEGVRGALTFRGSQDADRVRELIDGLRAGTVARVAFVAPTGTTWSLPLYELALQTAATLGAGAAGRLCFVTPEPAPMAVFGDEVSAMVVELLAERGVALHTGAHVDEVAGGELALGEQRLQADRVIALPRLVGRELRGIPSEELGFVPVDEYARVRGIDDVYAIGDLAGHAVKQGGLAAQQADVAAATIAAAAGAPVHPQAYRPVLLGMLVTGKGVLYLRRGATGPAEISDERLWWPAGKIAGRHLGPFLAAHLDLVPRPGGARRSLAGTPA
jgi:sulfide:quinone oxidoreductase